MLSFLGVFGLAAVVAPKVAHKIWRAWTGMPRMLRAEIDWDRFMPMPGRFFGLIMFLASAWMIYQPLAHSKREPLATIAFGGGEAVRHVNWTSAVFALAFLGSSIWMFVDPIGLMCFFRRIDRSEFPRHYKRGVPVILVAAVFLLAGVFLLVSELRGSG